MRTAVVDKSGSIAFDTDTNAVPPGKSNGKAADTNTVHHIITSHHKCKCVQIFHIFLSFILAHNSLRLPQVFADGVISNPIFVRTKNDTILQQILIYYVPKVPLPTSKQFGNCFIDIFKDPFVNKKSTVGRSNLIRYTHFFNSKILEF